MPEVTQATMPMAPTSSSKLPMILGVLILFLIAGFGIFWLRKQNTRFAATAVDESAVPIEQLFSDLKVELAHSRSRTGFFSYETPKVSNEPPFWWTNDDGVSILIEHVSILPLIAHFVFSNSASTPLQDWVEEPVGKISSFFERHGFTKNIPNSSSSLHDTRLYDYVVSFERNQRKCNLSINPDNDDPDNPMPPIDRTAIYVECSDEYQRFYNEQYTFASAFRGEEAVAASIDKIFNDFALVGVQYRRTGYLSVLKKKGDSYTELFGSQEEFDCENITKFHIPRGLIEDCYSMKYKKSIPNPVP